jgi:hypothetical protein
MPLRYMNSEDYAASRRSSMRRERVIRKLGLRMD